MTLLSRKDFPANTYPELLNYVKANKDKVSLANAGVGAVSQLCGLLFMSQIGVDLTTVPYKGAGPALNDLLGGHVDLLCDQTTQTAPVIKEGNRVKVFGVTTSKRLSSMPNIPTLDEQGLTGFDVRVWHGVYAQGHAATVIEKINARCARRCRTTWSQRLADLSSRSCPWTSHARGAPHHPASEITKWGKVTGLPAFRAVSSPPGCAHFVSFAHLPGQHLRPGEPVPRCFWFPLRGSVA